MSVKERINEMKIHHEERKEDRHQRYEEKKFAHEIKHQMKEEEKYKHKLEKDVEKLAKHVDTAEDKILGE